MTFDKKSDLQAALIFGLGGLGSGLISARLILLGVMFVNERQAHHGAYPMFWWPGGVFLVALSGCFVLCRTTGWPRIGDRPWRSLVAAVLIFWNTFIATHAALLTGIVGAVVVSPPAVRGVPPTTHSWLFFAVPIVIALIFGGVAASLLLALALYLFTGVWDPDAWIALLLSSIVATAATLAINPGFLMMLRGSSEGHTDDTSFGRGFSTLLILGYMFYGACAGYWIARSGRVAHP
jgi:hypothetical protein